uniref:Uncharacterized protein n=1 Tax=viral metagenome TaxID=1070528 RepID=A0A6C0BX70_9ZZZZ
MRMLLRTPISFECLAKSGFQSTVFKGIRVKLLNERNEILILINVLMEIVFLVELLINLFRLQVPVFSKELIEKIACGLDAFKLETIAVCRRFLLFHNSQQTPHNVSNVKCLIFEVELAQMRE